MKLTNVTITNSLGCRSFSADLKAPITLIAGSNGSGKSSLLQSIRFALTGELPRISLKKDGEQLVTDGAKSGTISVEWNDGGKAVVGLPSCKMLEWTAPNAQIHPAMPFLCQMNKFSSVDANERRSFLFGLTGTTASAEEVQKRLISRKAEQSKIDAILPLLRSGFPAAAKEAASHATQAKGAWKAISNETYGAKKAEGWTAATDNGTNTLVAADIPGLKAEATKLDSDAEQEFKALGAAEQARESAAKLTAQINGWRQQSGQIERISEKLNLDRAELKSFTEKLEALPPASGIFQANTTPCPCCGEALEIVGRTLIKYAPPPGGHQIDPDLESKRAEYQKAVSLYTRAVESGERDLSAANAAAAAIQNAEQNRSAVESDEDIAARRALIADIKERRAAVRGSITNAEAAGRMASEAETKTKKAAQHHADVEGWTLIADALAPDGIPGELLAQALKPINAALSQSAADAGWMVPTIDADMQIRADGRLFQLLSMSEKWRVDAMLTAAIALLSGVKVVLLDEFDVLDLPSRKQALGWLGVMAEAGEIHTAIVAGTLKALPPLSADFQGFWMSSGVLSELKEAA